MTLERRILVIDDNASIHGDFTKIFAASTEAEATLSQAETELFGDPAPKEDTSPRFILEHAFQGEEGAKMVQTAVGGQKPYSVAFVDVRMPPGLDGIETVSLIWQHDPDLQIVLCTAYSDYSLDEIARQLGRSDRFVILKKPFDNVEVLQLAHSLSEKWRLFRNTRAKMDTLEHMVQLRTKQQTLTMLELRTSLAERERSAAALHAAEAHKSAIIESAMDGIISVDHDGFIIEYNPAAERIFRIKRENALGLSTAKFFPAEFEVYLHRQLMSDAGHVDGQRLETYGQRADGSRFPMELALGKPGQPSQSRFTLFIRDLTERNRVQTRVAAFSTLAENLSAARTAEEASNLIASVAKELFDWDSCSVYLYSKEKDELTSSYHSAAESSGENAEAKKTLRSGARRYDAGGGAALSAPIYNNDTAIGVITVVSLKAGSEGEEDLAVLQSLANHCGGAIYRIRIDESRRLLAQRMESLLQSTGEGLLGIDANGICTFINRAGAAMVGMGSGEVVGGDFHEIFLSNEEESTPGNTTPIQETLRNGVPCRVQTEVFWRSDGTFFPVEYAAFPIMEGSEIRGAVVTFVSIEERKQLEERQRQLQKMEALGQLAGGVAHDFSNMLLVINGYCDMLLSAEDVQPSQSELLKEIYLAGERAAKLTNQLLIFSRNQPILLQPVNVADVVIDVAGLLRRLIGENVSLRIDTSGDLPLVLADTGSIEQVLLNLSINARDAMPKGGQLTIATHAARITETYVAAHPDARRGEFVCLSVQDTGCGISSELLSRIFEPFFTTKGVGEGTGLGLATVFGIVKQHQGWIEVESAIGAGTKFKVFLPISQAEASGSTAISNEPVTGGKETILLVEDEDSVRVLASLILQKYGYRVLEATNAEEAVEVWQRHCSRIELLFTDVLMTGELTGRELAERLQQEKPALKVIYTSGYSAEMGGGEHRDESFIQKPYHPRRLAEIVRATLDEEKISS